MNRADLLRCAPIALLACAPLAQADEELQKKLANPVADIITLPFQWTTTEHVGPLDRPQHQLNFQPVYPMKLDNGWSLIHRAIVPFMSNPALADGQDRKNGIGDITYEGFFTPAPQEGGLIWGVGPAVTLRTASDDRLGQGKWSAGPAVVLINQSGKWTSGALLTQVWSLAGDTSRRSVNAFSLQPIVAYRINPQYSIGYIGTLTADWQAERSSQRWTVPLGLSVSMLSTPKNFVPIDVTIGAGYNVVRPDNAGDWFVRAQVNFVLPK